MEAINLFRHALYIVKIFIVNLLSKIALWFLLVIPATINIIILSIKDKRILKDNLQNQRLWGWLKWCDVGDEIDRKYGVNGDLPYQNRYIKNHDNPSTWDLFKLRFNWLMIRNPLNYYQHHVIGFKFDEHDLKAFRNKDVSVDKDGDPVYGIFEIGDYYRPGFRYTIASFESNEADIFDTRKTKILREYYLMYLYPECLQKIFSRTRGIRIRIGYKLTRKPYSQPRPTIQMTFSCSFLSTYYGEYFCFPFFSLLKNIFSFLSDSYLIKK